MKDNQNGQQLERIRTGQQQDSDSQQNEGSQNREGNAPKSQMTEEEYERSRQRGAQSRDEYSSDSQMNIDDDS